MVDPERGGDSIIELSGGPHLHDIQMSIRTNRQKRAQICLDLRPVAAEAFRDGGGEDGEFQTVAATRLMNFGGVDREGAPMVGRVGFVSQRV